MCARISRSIACAPTRWRCTADSCRNTRTFDITHWDGETHDAIYLSHDHAGAAPEPLRGGDGRRAAKLRAHIAYSSAEAAFTCAAEASTGAGALRCAEGGERVPRHRKRRSA